MAKAENTPKTGTSGLTGGLDFGASREEKARQLQEEQERLRLEQMEKERQEKNKPTNFIVEEYKKNTRYERRNVKINAMITPSLSKKMDDSLEKGEIRSKNDLINQLLEMYYAEGEKA